MICTAWDWEQSVILRFTTELQVKPWPPACHSGRLGQPRQVGASFKEKDAVSPLCLEMVNIPKELVCVSFFPVP